MKSYYHYPFLGFGVGEGEDTGEEDSVGEVEGTRVGVDVGAGEGADVEEGEGVPCRVTLPLRQISLPKAMNAGEALFLSSAIQAQKVAANYGNAGI